MNIRQCRLHFIAIALGVSIISTPVRALSNHYYLESGRYTNVLSLFAAYQKSLALNCFATFFYLDVDLNGEASVTQYIIDYNSLDQGHLLYLQFDKEKCKYSSNDDIDICEVTDYTGKQYVNYGHVEPPSGGMPFVQYTDLSEEEYRELETTGVFTKPAVTTYQSSCPDRVKLDKFYAAEASTDQVVSAVTEYEKNNEDVGKGFTEQQLKTLSSILGHEIQE